MNTLVNAIALFLAAGILYLTGAAFVQQVHTIAGAVR